MSVASFSSASADTAGLDCDPLRRIDFTCEEAGRELESVAAAQRMLLPARLPEAPGLDLAVAYRPARQAGGDLYDFLPLPGGGLGVFVADVTGHGAAAALLAAVVHGMVRACPHAGSPADLLAFINDWLTVGERDWHGRFVTAFYGVYDPATRTLTYANAGHPTPRLLSGEDV
jgi:sigma-B regulation protein RsbU (phosphoserine phosphatase)